MKRHFLRHLSLLSYCSRLVKHSHYAGLMLLSALFASLSGPSVVAQEATEPQFSGFYDRVYQIVVLEDETNNKSALGSGFQISGDGLVVTNYHVISQLVFEPENHRVEFVDKDEKKGALELITFDVINDLAILRRVEGQAPHLELSTAPPSRGDSIYSLGNPHDIGMLMVSGAYNGLAESDYTPRILFSGSLNSGMSGGPTLNERGEVVGVNVSTAGSQLSFLVPVAQVVSLLSQVDSPLQVKDYFSHIREQIATFQRDYFAQLFAGDWTLEDLGDAAQVPGEMGLDTTCWGQSNEQNKDALHKRLNLTCGNSNNIYLQPYFSTGVLHYSYDYREREKLGKFRFHNHTGDSSYYPDNRGSSESVSNYSCEQTYLERDEGAPEDHYIQVGFCSRAYLDFADLYDVLYYRQSAGADSALTSHFTLAGVDEETVAKFTERFAREVKWK
ncbi:MAG: serine protease [Gammaproteobacteria bacterium]